MELAWGWDRLPLPVCNGVAMKLKAPFPWFGGKSRVAHLVWDRFGDTLNYVEPFAGSLAVLLARPFPVRTETVNDKDPYLSNFWRAVTADPEQVAYYADWPVNETDLHARHLWLVNQKDFREKMLTDPDYYDPKIAGWWVWGQSCWIGSGWCDISQYERNKGKRVNLPQGGGRGDTTAALTRNGRSRPNLRPAQGIEGIPSRQIPHLNGDSGAAGAGLHATAFNRKTGGICAYMEALKSRLRNVRVTCGDWSRIMSPSVTYGIGMTAVFLDPPYDPDVRQEGIYSVDDTDEKPISTAVRDWCLEEISDGKGKAKFTGPRYLHPKLRIALCGYWDEHAPFMPDDWECVRWKANGGYSNQNKAGNDNRHQECIWFSPNCLKPHDPLRGLVDTRDYNDLFELPGGTDG